MLFEQHERSLVVHAPAKLNLFLEVIGRRPDGFHEIETVMVSVGIRDTLTFAEGGSNGCCEFRVARAEACHLGSGARGAYPDARNAEPALPEDEAVPDDERNLVVRAAKLLRERTGCLRGVRIELVKRIPAASGLAGGSSDAAATLAGLNRLWELGLSRDALCELASELGSDVPFFLVPAAVAIARGRGEILEPLDVPLGLHFVVVRPATGLSTAEVYRRCRPARRPRTSSDLVAALREGRLAGAARRTYNALQEPAESLNAEVAGLRSWFGRQGLAGHLMSGSGTAYFGICRTRGEARRVAGRLRAARCGRVFVAQCGL